MLRFLRYPLLLLVIAIFLFIAWLMIALNWSYSEGQRVGYVQKFSNKGWLCKSWEGELVLVTMPGAIPDRFEFSVRDEAVAAKINQLSGKRAALIYQQHRYLPTSCFGDTEFFIVDAHSLDDEKNVPLIYPGVLPSPSSPDNSKGKVEQLPATVPQPAAK